MRRTGLNRLFLFYGFDVENQCYIVQLILITCRLGSTVGRIVGRAEGCVVDASEGLVFVAFIFSIEIRTQKHSRNR